MKLIFTPILEIYDDNNVRRNWESDSIQKEIKEKIDKMQIIPKAINSLNPTIKQIDLILPNNLKFLYIYTDKPVDIYLNSLDNTPISITDYLIISGTEITVIYIKNNSTQFDAKVTIAGGYIQE